MAVRQKGFTLIELVLVIVILGILAAAALPRFSDLSTQARVSAISGLAGSLRGAAAIAHSTQLVQRAASNATINVETQPIVLANGYPDAASIDNMLSDYSGFTYDGAGTFTMTAACTLTYNESVGGAFPVLTSDLSGC